MSNALLTDFIKPYALRMVMGGRVFITEHYKQMNMCRASYDLEAWFTISRTRILDDDKAILTCINMIRKNEEIIVARALQERKAQLREELDGANQQVRVSTGSGEHGEGQPTAAYIRCNSCNQPNCASRNTAISAFCMGSNPGRRG